MPEGDQRLEFQRIIEAWRGFIALPAIRADAEKAARRFHSILEQPIRAARSNNRISYEYSEHITRRAAKYAFDFIEGCISVGLEYGTPAMSGDANYPAQDDHIMALLTLAFDGVRNFLGVVITECRLDSPHELRRLIVSDIAEDMLELAMDLFNVGAKASDQARQLPGA